MKLPRGFIFGLAVDARFLRCLTGLRLQNVSASNRTRAAPWIASLPLDGRGTLKQGLMHGDPEFEHVYQTAHSLLSMLLDEPRRSYPGTRPLQPIAPVVTPSYWDSLLPPHGGLHLVPMRAGGPVRATEG